MEQNSLVLLFNCSGTILFNCSGTMLDIGMTT
uniref:Uncharacterized protein n=1 Tax=Arundo donax TaxID=35708 RepID=A0A0A9BE03_ARUDO